MLTLKEQLQSLIEKYGMIEVLDRLAQVSHENCKTDNSCTGCDRLTALIEEATMVAKQHHKG